MVAGSRTFAAGQGQSSRDFLTNFGEELQPQWGLVSYHHPIFGGKKFPGEA